MMGSTCLKRVVVNWGFHPGSPLGWKQLGTALQPMCMWTDLVCYERNSTLRLSCDVIWMHVGKWCDSNGGYWWNCGLSTHHSSQFWFGYLVCSSWFWALKNGKNKVKKRHSWMPPQSPCEMGRSGKKQETDDNWYDGMLSTTERMPDLSRETSQTQPNSLYSLWTLRGPTTLHHNHCWVSQKSFCFFSSASSCVVAWTCIFLSRQLQDKCPFLPHQ